MILTSIRVSRFRNFEDKNVTIHPFLTIIIGENAQGKTNLLESIYFSVYGTGFREWREEDLIRWNENRLQVETRWQEKDNKMMFNIILSKKSTGAEKKFAVNKVQKTHSQYQQYQTAAVLFAPEHIEIVAGSPDSRRSYINKLLSVTDAEYKKRIQNYEHALRKRNKVLEVFKNAANLEDELDFWNGYLEEQATYITRKRQAYVDYLNAHNKLDHRVFEVQYVKNELTKSRLKEVLEEEKRWRRTLIGPQKDDVQIFFKAEILENIQLYGSRSEQRLAVFWLKLNELHYLEDIFKRRPILLLDDVFSELDIKNKALIMHLIKSYQTILTTTEVELLEVAEMPKEVIEL